MTDRIFAFGDLHGHHDEFKLLLAKIIKEANYNPAVDHLALLGDLVDNGDKTKEILEWAIEYKKKYPDTFHPLRGNHENMMLDALRYDNKKYGDYYFWFNQGGRQTVSSYLPKDISDQYQRAIMQPLDYIPKQHLDFIDQLPHFWETDEYFFVHGGVPPKLLKNTDFTDPDVLEQILWIREEFYQSGQKWEKKIIFAHTPFEHHLNDGEFIIHQDETMIGINTMPRNVGYLTCVELPTEKFYRQDKL